MLFIISCEYKSKIILSKSKPVLLHTADNSVIKEISISSKKAENSSYTILFRVNLPINTRELLLDSVLSSISHFDLNAYEQYSVSIRTNKGIGGVQFYIDSLGIVNIISNR